MASELLAGLGAFKAMFDLAKGLKDINDAATRNGVAIELQEKILSAQAAQAALIEHVGELEKRMADFETWDIEQQKYELAEVAPGTFAYALKSETQGTEPPHWICANCFQKHQKSILQRTSQIRYRRRVYLCHNCDGEIDVEGGGAETPRPTVQNRQPPT